MELFQQQLLGLEVLGPVCPGLAAPKALLMLVPAGSAPASARSPAC